MPGDMISECPSDIIGIRRLPSQEWGKFILLTKHRDLLTPILVYCDDPNLDLLPAMPAAEKRRRPAAAHQQIAKAIAAVRAVCNPHRSAEAHHEPRRTRRSAQARR